MVEEEFVFAKKKLEDFETKNQELEKDNNDLKNRVAESETDLSKTRNDLVPVL